MTESDIDINIGENCNIELLNQGTIDFWENDDAEPKIDEKIQKKFDSYFLDYSSEQLHINSVEFNEIQLYSKKYDRIFDSDTLRRDKYIEIDEY